MKIEWMTPQQTVEAPAIAFSFDDVAQLVEGRLTISWLNEGGSPVRLHNLVISDTGTDAETLGKAVIKATEKPFTKYRKGKLTDGTARDVYPIFNDPSLPFRAGLTVHAARGTWSSLPHEFEREEILTPRPMPFYEKFAYVTDPPGGWGVQVRIGHLFSVPRSTASYITGSPGDDEALQPSEDYSIEWVRDAVVIRDRDILDIPLGSHPVSGGPGVRMCYFWAYASDPLMWEQREKFK